MSSLICVYTITRTTSSFEARWNYHYNITHSLLTFPPGPLVDSPDHVTQTLKLYRNQIPLLSYDSSYNIVPPPHIIIHSTFQLCECTHLKLVENQNWWHFRHLWIKNNNNSLVANFIRLCLPLKSIPLDTPYSLSRDLFRFLSPLDFVCVSGNSSVAMM